MSVCCLSVCVTRHACPHRGQGARFLLRAHYKHFCTKIIKSLERGPLLPPPPSVGVTVCNTAACSTNSNSLAERFFGKLQHRNHEKAKTGSVPGEKLSFKIENVYVINCNEYCNSIIVLLVIVMSIAFHSWASLAL